jgi:hypothetical protein
MEKTPNSNALTLKLVNGPAGRDKVNQARILRYAFLPMSPLAIQSTRPHVLSGTCSIPRSIWSA